MQDEALTQRLIRQFNAVNHELDTLAQYLQLPLHRRPLISAEQAAIQLRSFEHRHHELQYAAEELLQLAHAVESALRVEPPAPAAVAETPGAAATPLRAVPSSRPAVDQGPGAADALSPQHVLTSRPEQADLERIYLGTKPAAFTLLGTAVTVDSWRELYLRVLSLLARHDPAVFRQLPQTPLFITKTGQNDFAEHPDGYRNPLAIEYNLYTEGKRSASQILYRVGKLLDTFQLPRNSFTVTLAPQA
jgi:hypothetical protein